MAIQKFKSWSFTESGRALLNLMSDFMMVHPSPQVTIPDEDTTYWCAATQLPPEVREQERYITRVRKLALGKGLEFYEDSLVGQYILSFSHPLCQALQKTNCDIVKAYRNAKLCQTTISAQRNEIKFSDLWIKAEAIADQVGTELTKPRTTHSSRYRSNAGVDTQDAEDAEAYYRRNVYYPFVDHCVSEFSQRFPDSAESMFIGYKLLPNKVSSISTEAVEAIVDFYGPDMPNIDPSVSQYTFLGV